MTPIHQTELKRRDAIQQAREIRAASFIFTAGLTALWCIGKLMILGGV